MRKNSQKAVRDYYITYEPAVLHFTEKQGYYIDFFVREDGKMQRHCIKLNKIATRLTQKEFDAYVKKLINKINAEISLNKPSQIFHNSPNLVDDDVQNNSIDIPAAPLISPPAVVPALSNQSELQYITIDNLRYKFINERRKELRPDSIRSYSSFTSVLMDYLTNNNVVSNLDVTMLHITHFMDYVYNIRNVSVVSYNNYVKAGRAFFAWCVERCFFSENLFTNISKKKTQQEKKRTLIPADWRRAIVKYCEQLNRPTFSIICMLVYNSLIRPKEIRNLQIRHLHLDDLYIEIPGEIAKNHKTRQAAITPQLLQLFTNMNLERYPLDYYVFGSHLVPSKKIAGEKCYYDFWSKIKNELDMPDNFSLYSLRDTGITNMLQMGIPSIDVMKLADHSSLDVTTIYTRHRDDKLLSRLFNIAPKF